jgi:hypothetical protein
MGILIASGFLAFLAWWVTPTSLNPEDVRNSEGEITFWSFFSVVFVQLILWTLVFFVYRIVPYLPEFFTTGWRLPLTVFIAAFCQWFGLFMILQYGWTIVAATGKTAVMVILSVFGSRSTRRALDDAPWQFIRKYGDESAEPNASNETHSRSRENER